MRVRSSGREKERERDGGGGMQRKIDQYLIFSPGDMFKS